MCALCVVVVPIKVVGQQQRARPGAPKAHCRVQKQLRGVQQLLDECNIGFRCLVEPRYMDSTNLDAWTSSTTICSGTRTSRYTGTNGYYSRSATSTTKQFYSAAIVPDAPKSGDHTDDYDDAIGADQHAAKPGHAAHAHGSDASHRIEQGLRRLGEWLMLLNAIKSYMC